MNIADIRREYTLKELDIAHAHADAMTQFIHWFDEALNSDLPEPTAMNLATVSAEGRPSSRIVLLKGIDSGFVFYTNYASRKGNDLAYSPYAGLTFFWAELERQVRIEGRVEKVEDQLSDEYFGSRPMLSQISAIASPQSRVIESSKVIEDRVHELLHQYGNMHPPRPEHWGGYRLVPERIEFWQGRRSRLHDRLLYTRKADDNWQIETLAP